MGHVGAAWLTGVGTGWFHREERLQSQLRWAVTFIGWRAPVEQGGHTSGSFRAGHEGKMLGNTTHLADKV